MIDWLGDNAAAGWLIAAGLLGVTELFMPGVFLVFLAIAAAVMGFFVLLFPELPLAAQLIGFGAWSLVTVLIGRRWYRENPIGTDDPLLNDRGARMLGQVVAVTCAIEGGEGRVRIGDGEWPARGPDAGIGTRVRIVGVSGASVEVEPLPQLPTT